MDISTFTALRLAAYTTWERKVRSALRRGKSVAKAAVILTAEGLECSRGKLFIALRKHPGVIDDELRALLPVARGLKRGEARQDLRPGWQASSETLKRKQERAQRKTKRAQPTPPSASPTVP